MDARGTSAAPCGDSFHVESDCSGESPRRWPPSGAEVFLPDDAVVVDDEGLTPLARSDQQRDAQGNKGGEAPLSRVDCQRSGMDGPHFYLGALGDGEHA